MDRLVRITTSRKQKLRSDYGRAVARGLRSRGYFRDVPTHMVRGYASLHTLAAEVRAKLKEKGLETAEGLPSPFIAEYRQLMLAQGKYLQIILEVAASVKGGNQAPDLVAMMASSQVDETVERADLGESEGHSDG